MTSPLLSYSPELHFLTTLESSQSSLKVVLSKAGAANRPTEEVQKDGHSGVWNLNPSLSELCMSPENKALYSLQSWRQWRWLPELVQVTHFERIFQEMGLEKKERTHGNGVDLFPFSSFVIRLQPLSSNHFCLWKSSTHLWPCYFPETLGLGISACYSIFWPRRKD